jgi:hypothetical protein
MTSSETYPQTPPPGKRSFPPKCVTKPEVDAPTSMQLALRDGSGSAAARCIRHEGGFEGKAPSLCERFILSAGRRFISFPTKLGVATAGDDRLFMLERARIQPRWCPASDRAPADRRRMGLPSDRSA